MIAQDPDTKLSETVVHALIQSEVFPYPGPIRYEVTVHHLAEDLLNVDVTFYVIDPEIVWPKVDIEHLRAVIIDSVNRYQNIPTT